MIRLRLHIIFTMGGVKTWTRRLLTGLALTTTLILLLLHDYLHPTPVRRDTQPSHVRHGRTMLVNTSACRLPEMDPMHPSIAAFVRHPGRMRCGPDPPVTYVDGRFLRINRSYLLSTEPLAAFSHCRYQTVMRNEEDNNDFSYGSWSRKFRADVKVEDEFIRAVCYNASGVSMSTAFHEIIVTKKDVERRCDRNSKKHVELHRPKEMLSVQMIGVDSVSRLNLMRQMPLTREFLLKDLQAVEMLGYNKVADNTFVNVVPLLTGKFVEELPWNESLADKPFDKYPLIWKNFSSAGYRTMFAEDAPYMGTFDYSKRGFIQAPTDYYNRAFLLALEEDKTVWNNGHCVNNILETELHLDYATAFSRQFRSKPHFGFTFIARLTHDDINMAGAADEPYLKFLRTLKTENLLDNTVLVFFSDHGIRFGDIRNTYIGKAEERLPFVFLVFPAWFGKRYPELMRNLRLNSNRLTTPFDIYETLKDIVYFDGKTRTANVSQRGISLFREIPEARSCAHAGILPHWCTCMDRKVVSPSTDIVQKVARLLVDKINSLLNHHSDLCAKLSLHTVHKADEFESKEDLLRFEQSVNDVIDRQVTFGERVSAPVMYQVTIETLPGNGLFEATAFTYDGGETMRLQGDISRINTYGSQSDCISNHQLHKFCFCTT